MDTLHIVRSVPDATTQQIKAEFSNKGRNDVIKLFDADIDWEGVVDAIFNSKRVVCWW